MRSVTVALPGRAYQVDVGSGALAGVGEGLDRLGSGRRVALVTDAAIARSFGATVAGAVAATGRTVELLPVPSGEASKSLRELERLYLEFARLRLDRGSAVLALGGGVVGDLAGFAAATYLRGIDLVQLPTTLLAQVDASVGGKTAIDLPVGKNLVGAFHQPRWVVADVATLATLPPRELRAGLAEVIKYGVIADAALFALLEREQARILAGEPEALAEIVFQSCRIKADVVTQDEREGGLRAILNYGHTVGHGVEAAAGYTGLLHGECVAIGMTAAAAIAVRTGLLAQAEADRQRRLLQLYGLPIAIPAELDGEAILAAMRLDKKTRDDEIHFVLPRRIGAVEIGCRIPGELLADVLEELRAP
jgi:3-dehydroquinate synthase